MPLCGSQFPPVAFSCLKDFYHFLGRRLAWGRILSISVCLTKCLFAMIFRGYFVGVGQVSLLWRHCPCLWPSCVLTSLAHLSSTSRGFSSFPFCESLFMLGFQTSWSSRQAKPCCSSLGLWFTSHFGIWDSCIFTVHSCLPTPLLQDSNNQFGVILWVTAALCFFFLSAFFLLFVWGHNFNKANDSRSEFGSFLLPLGVCAAALLLRKHLGAGHLCVRPPASSSHPCRCFPLRRHHLRKAETLLAQTFLLQMDYP